MVMPVCFKKGRRANCSNPARHLVQDRMGITGARWGLPGAQAILWLRALHASGDHDAYWDYHLAQGTPAQPPQPLPPAPFGAPPPDAHSKRAAPL